MAATALIQTRASNASALARGYVLFLLQGTVVGCSSAGRMGRIG